MAELFREKMRINGLYTYGRDDKINEYILSEEESKRISIIKFICIVLVVFMHSYITDVNYVDGVYNITFPGWFLWIETVISYGLGRTAVPLFFVLSGIFLFGEQCGYLKLLKKKTISVLVPYLFWNTFWILIFFILQMMPFTSIFFSQEENIVSSWNGTMWLEKYGVSYSLEQPFLFPLWFMRDLMVIIILQPIINYFIVKYPKMMLAFCAILFVAPVLFSLKTALTYVILGGCIAHLNIRMKEIDKLPLGAVGFIYIVLITFFTYLENYLVIQLMVLTGMIFWVKVSARIYHSHIMERKWFWSAVESTFFIYVAHEMTLALAQKLFIRVLPQNSFTFVVEYFGLPGLTVVCIVLCAAWLKSRTKGFYEIIAGGR